jgi:glycosyltransferase involved in cell wall biosynthesis
MPAKCSDVVVTLTHGWRHVLKKKGWDSVVIPAGIDVDSYNKKIDYTNNTFGRITRWSSGKVHPRWNQVVKSLITIHKNYRCVMITKCPQKIHDSRVMYIENIKIHEHQKKINALAQMSVFADMHNTFQETFSLCLLEAMASGLACIMYSVAPQPSMMEILGDAGIWCFNENDFVKKLTDLVQNTEKKTEYGLKARYRARQYSIKNMITAYNRIFKGVLNKK